MPPPAITFVGIGGVLETVAAQRVQHLVLDGLNRRRKIRNQVMRVGVEADDGRVRQKTRDVFLRTLRAENLVVHARQKIPVKTANGLRRAQNGPADAVRIEFDQRPVALLDFDNAVLNWHHHELYRSGTNTQCRFNAAARAALNQHASRWGGINPKVEIRRTNRPPAVLRFGLRASGFVPRELEKSSEQRHAADEAQILGVISRSPTKRATFGWWWWWKCLALLGGQAG